MRWGSSASSLALLAHVGVDEEGFREVLAVEVAGSEKGAAYASLLRGLLDRGLKRVRLVVSDDHEGIKAAVSGELPGAEWQRCVVHLEGNVLAHVRAGNLDAPNDMQKVVDACVQASAEVEAQRKVEGR